MHSDQERKSSDRDKYLADLARRFPGEWAEVRECAKSLVASGRAADLNEYMLQAHAVVEGWTTRHRELPPAARAAVPREIAVATLKLAALERYYRAALAGTASGEVELSRRDMAIAQRLFFTRGLERRAVSMRAFNFWWRFIARKGGVMSLLQKMGIYCVYSSDLIAALAAMIGRRTCLEVGAGDGTLSLLLEKAGVSIQAVDDQSWRHKIKYPAWVEKLDAVSALARYEPQVVLCSWPPPGNAFEREIFRAPAVERYIVIGSKHRFASGDWSAYERQKRFRWAEDAALTRLVVPPELESAVLVFERIDAGLVPPRDRT